MSVVSARLITNAYFLELPRKYFYDITWTLSFSQLDAGKTHNAANAPLRNKPDSKGKLLRTNITGPTFEIIRRVSIIWGLSNEVFEFGLIYLKFLTEIHVALYSAN